MTHLILIVDRVASGELPTEYIGKRNMIVYEPNHGTVLLTEGFHFTIEDRCMSKDWAEQELQAVSQVMQAARYVSYEEFCEALDNGCFTITAPSTALTDDGQPTEG